MNTLQQVHLRIQELSKEYQIHIPVNSIVQDFDDNPEVISQHIESLSHLSFIAFTDGTRKEIILTETGKLANIPFMAT